MATRKERSSSNGSPGTTPTPPPASGLQTEEGTTTRPSAGSTETPANQGAGFDPSMMEKFFSFMSFYEQHQQGAPAQSNNSNNNNNVTPMSLDGSSYARGNQQQQPTFALYEPQRGLQLQRTKPFDGKDFFTWSFEFELMMEGAQILGFFDSVSQLMAKGIHLEADSATQEFKLYHGRGGLYIGKAVLKNNVFVLDFVPDLGTADSDAIVNFTNWTHPPDLDPDFSPEGFWYSHTIPEAERTRALATIQTTSAAAETSSAVTEPLATPTTLTTPIATSSTSPHIDTTSSSPAQQLTPAPRKIHRSANFTAAFYSNSDLYRRSPGHRAIYAPLEKVYSDILYNREPGQGAYSYTITFVDAATRYVWHLNLPSKDMAFEAFIAWLPVAERESGEKLKSFQSDGRGEYTSQRFKQFLAEKGIKRLVSLPYAHQQQGVAERLNRTLQNTMRKLLRGMRLPNHQWPEAMDHAVMLHNLLSSSSLLNNASPHLLWIGK
ncbi:unnamed protein product [Closterium sp. NIES-54]